MTRTASVGRSTPLAAAFAGKRTTPAVYQWQVNKTALIPKAGSQRYTFTRPGKYNIRVAITDNVGHVAVRVCPEPLSVIVDAVMPQLNVLLDPFTANVAPL